MADLIDVPAYTGKRNTEFVCVHHGGKITHTLRVNEIVELEPGNWIITELEEEKPNG